MNFKTSDNDNFSDTDSESKSVNSTYDENYRNGKIYRLVCADLVYYGSTYKNIKHRLLIHKAHAKDKYSKTHRYSSRQLFELSEQIGEPVKVELVENYPCSSRKELEQREGWYIRTYKCVNKNCTGRTPEEKRRRRHIRYMQNAEKYRALARERYHKNPEKSREYYLRNRERILARSAEKRRYLKQCQQMVENTTL